ncbi:D-glucuronyl C5-epimerase [Thermococcus sp. M39]|uniref:D-glucuronyl C5-epimerase family protein n=1 Tax=unclassified Thermococcus TaxID=2627626 RepID=UPI001439EDDB|nr:MULTISPECIES: D-glucuronyl C5-epimerase family protein [unclassified Thermococcus]NJE09030.1 D-glucuronyl C5-epimerase [Thermococcus sp. M39]NJE13305.1 D-glucuronyl C5-epimerase [Thermococcus sp. LS2]
MREKALILVFMLLTSSLFAIYENAENQVLAQTEDPELITLLQGNENVVLDNFIAFLSTMNPLYLISSFEASYPLLVFSKVELTPERNKILKATLRANNEFYSHYLSPLKSFYAVSFASSAPYNSVFLANSSFKSALPYVHYNFRGLVLYPVTALHWADVYFQIGKEEKALEILRELRQYLVTKNYQGLEYAVFENYFHFENSSIPWISGYAQGLGAGLYARAYNITKNESYLKTAQLLMNSFRVSYSKGGFVVNSTYGLWILEYAYNSNELVLNGHIIALQGVYYYWEITNDTYAKWVFDEGVKAVKKALPDFDENGWSLYSNIHGRAMKNYHKLHIQLLEWLYEKTKDEKFKEYAERWRRSLQNVG